MTKKSESSSVPLLVNVIAVFSLAIMVALLSLSLLPEDQFGLSSLLFGIVSYEATDESNDAPPPPPRPIAVFGSDYAQPPAYTPAANFLADFSADSSAYPFTASSAASPEASPGPSPAASDLLSSETEKFLLPVLTHDVGAGNQLMEYISAAVIARATNRILCLIPFFQGPGKYNGIKLISHPTTTQ